MNLVSKKELFNFWNDVQHYPAWFKKGFDCVCPFVQNVKEELKGYNVARIEMILTDGSAFVFQTRDISRIEVGFSAKNVEILFNGKPVASFDLELDDISANYLMKKTHFIRLGDWRKHLKSFTKWHTMRRELKYPKKG